MKARRGGSHFGIGVVNPKTEINIGTLWRSAWQLGAEFLFTAGARYKRQSSDTYSAPDRIPLWHFDTPEDIQGPYSYPLVAVEFDRTRSVPLSEFRHPRQCVYILGAEDNGVPRSVLDRCHYVVSIPSVRTPSYNVAVAGSLVMYDRLVKS